MLIRQPTAVRSRLSELLTQLTVEPIIFLVYLGWVFGNTFQAPGVYRRICQIYYGSDAAVDCHLIRNFTVEDTVQENAAVWTLFNALAYLIPAIFADIVLGAYGDRYGRKTNILLGICGLTVAELGFLLTLSVSVATPYWTTLIFGAISGTTGFISMIPVSCNAYLADVTDDPKILTIRSGIFSSFQMLASVIGAFTAAGLAASFSIPVAMDIELFLFLLAFAYTLWRIPQKPGLQEIDRKANARAVRPIGVEPKKKKPAGQIAREFLGDMVILVTSGIESYRKPREGNRRAFMFLTAITLMISYTTAVETRTSGLINTFVFRRTDEGALGWSTRDLGFWNGCGYSLLLIGTLTGLIIFKRILKFRETTIILIGLTSACLRTLLIAVATNDVIMYIANVAGLFAGLIQPAVVSFMTQLIPSNEIGRVFSLFGIGADLALVVATLVYSLLYQVSVPWSPSLIFFIMFALQALVIFAMLWVHWQSQKEGIGNDFQPEIKPRSVQKAISMIGEAPSLDSSSVSKKSPPKNKFTGKRQISIIQHAEDLENQQNQVTLWASMEDLRPTQRNSSQVAFY